MAFLFQTDFRIWVFASNSCPRRSSDQRLESPAVFAFFVVLGALAARPAPSRGRSARSAGRWRRIGSSSSVGSSSCWRFVIPSADRPAPAVWPPTADGLDCCVRRLAQILLHWHYSSERRVESGSARRSTPFSLTSAIVAGRRRVPRLPGVPSLFALGDGGVPAVTTHSRNRAVTQSSPITPSATAMSSTVESSSDARRTNRFGSVGRVDGRPENDERVTGESRPEQRLDERLVVERHVGPRRADG